MNPHDQCCATCIWSRWYLTPTGRIAKNSSGKCVVPLPPLTLPVSITMSYWYRPINDEMKTGVQTDDGSDCPLWKANEGKPISGVVERTTP